MDLRITFRHGDVSDALRERAEARAGKLARYEPRLLAVDVLLDHDGPGVAAEVRAVVPGAPPIIARGQGENGRAALDRAVDKVARRLRRLRSRRVDHKAPPLAGVED